MDREQDRVHDENEWLRPDPKAEALGRRIRRDLQGSVPADAVLALLPASADPLAPQDPFRRSQLAERLLEIARQALRLPEGAPPPAPPAADREALTRSVCTGCRGSCCRSGGDHAYLTEETMGQFLRTHPGTTPEQAVAAYLERLPAESILDSCVYHSATGCGLPREMRSDTCNRHLCGKLAHLLDTLPRQAPPPVLGVFFDQGRWVRTALVDEAGCRVLDDSAEE